RAARGRRGEGEVPRTGRVLLPRLRRAGRGLRDPHPRPPGRTPALARLHARPLPEAPRRRGPAPGRRGGRLRQAGTVRTAEGEGDEAREVAHSGGGCHCRGRGSRPSRRATVVAPPRHTPSTRRGPPPA